MYEGIKQAVGFQVPDMSIGLDEEKGFGFVTLRGTARKVGEVDLHLPEGLQCGNKRAGFVLDAKHDERLVMASGCIDLPAENDMAHPGGVTLRISLGKNFRADREVGGGQFVECGVDESMNGIFERNNSAVGLVRTDLFNHLGDRVCGRVSHAGAEFRDGRLVRGAAGWTEARDDDVVFQSEGGRHDLPVNCANRLGAERAVAAVDEAAQQLHLAVWRVDGKRGAVFDNADFFRQSGALVEKAQQLCVKSVDALAQFSEVAHG